MGLSFNVRTQKAEIIKIRSSQFKSDIKDIAAAARGDRASLNRLYANHAKRLHAIAWRMTQNVDASEEIVQETFLRIWKNADRYDAGKAKPATWMNRITSNLCIDWQRKIKEVTIDRLDDRPDLSGSSNLEYLVNTKQVAGMVQDALIELPVRQRLAITLTVYLDLSNAEAATTMSISEQAIESLLARARRGLRQSLAPKRKVLLDRVSNGQG